jgi:hypothetical protein
VLGVDCGVGASDTYICLLTIRRFSSILIWCRELLLLHLPAYSRFLTNKCQS